MTRLVQALKLLTTPLLIALVLVVGANPRRVYTQAQALLFGSYNNTAKAVTVDASGNLNVKVQGSGLTALVVNGGTVTTNTPLATFLQTWNNAATVFHAIDIAITNTASNANSLLLSLKTGAGGTTDALRVFADGSFISAGAGTYAGLVSTTASGFQAPAAGYLNWLNASYLTAPADGQLLIRNNAVTAGAGFDVTTDNTLKVRGRAFTAGTGNLDLGGTVTGYNNETVAGLGVGYIRGSGGISATKTANFTSLTVTPAATASVYRVFALITTTSATNTGTVQITLDYKDSQGTTHTADIIPLVDAAGAVATTKTGASKEFHTVAWEFTTDNSATAINVKAVITGTVSYTVTSTIERLSN